ncbi:MAG: hypothetical protein V4733_04715 [Verrucomicrobiota bacterium]
MTFRTLFRTATFLIAGLSAAAYSAQKDWLVDATGFTAKVEKNKETREITLTNGLVSRTFFAGPNLATSAYDNLTTGETMIRAIRPEGSVTINGVKNDIGGLIGQTNQAYFTHEEVRTLKADPAAMKFIGMEQGVPKAPFEWKRVRHHAPDAEWPPKGVSLRFDFEPTSALGNAARVGKVLWTDDFLSLNPGWKIARSNAAERVLFVNEGKPGEIYAPMHLHCFAERAVPADALTFETVVDYGTDLSPGGWGPGMALVFNDGSTVKVNLRPGDRGAHGQFELRDKGGEKLASVKAFADTDGGLSGEFTYRLRATLIDGGIRWDVATNKNPDQWHALFTSSRPADPVKAIRIGKMDRSGGAGDDLANPRDFGRSKIQEVTVRGAPDAAAPAPKKADSPYLVSVHYELYDGVPLIVKWISVTNRGKETITLDKITTELLAMPEYDNQGSTPLPPDSLIVTTDYSFGGGFEWGPANSHVVRYVPDKSFTSQANYGLQSPCLLEVSPNRGPAQDVKPGETFTSYRTYQLAADGDRERRSLAYRRMMRVTCPWVTENPLMMHVKSSDPKTVRTAIDQAAEVGFEMVILSFGSGFNAENSDPAYLAKWKEVADYAKSKKIDLGTYSLYASRSVGGGNDIVPPKDRPNAFGTCPAITSPWGQGYLKKLQNLFPATGFTVFEHDGPYPGDVDSTPRPPLQKGEHDSQYVHWKIWTDFYKNLRAQGVYINAPDYYFHSGTNKIGMGYREVNWSLPRAQQLIHTRQNIYDGTWERTPSMGWMFVPLTQYHGGGAAATIEPLDQHIDHYNTMMLSNLANGVQACYRGTRLYDTPRVRDMVKKNVDWFKKYRDILEGDVLHLRRANGRTLDGMLHVKPGGKIPAMLCVFNPTTEELTETWDVPLHYAGLGGKVTASIADENPAALTTDRTATVRQTLRVPAGGFVWITYR